MKKLLIGFITFFLLNVSLSANELISLENKIIKLAPKGAVLLYDENFKPLYKHHADKVLVPASIFKIATSISALDILGSDYHFKTDFFLNPNGDLLIRGLGDPLLLSETLHDIAEKLKKQGLHKIRSIKLDSSAFLKEKVPGISKTLNPYDAINGALVVNFNTINLYRHSSGKVYSGEEETPLTRLAARKGKSLLSPGTKRRINFTASPTESLIYAGELFIEIFRQNDIQILNSRPRIGNLTGNWQLFYRYENPRSLKDIIKMMLKYSNNFIANQLFLVMGAKQKGYPATMSKSVKTMKGYFKDNLHFNMKNFQFDEGSGISRNNRVTANIMMELLKEFIDDYRLLPLESGAYLKTGTLKGVYNLAGYIQTAKGLNPFVIIINQKRNYRKRILTLLKKYSEKKEQLASVQK